MNIRKNLIGIIAGVGVGLTTLLARADPVTNIEMTVTNDCNVNWNWATQYMVRATSANLAKGTVSGNTNDWTDLGSNATINVSPALYYHFVNWSNGPAGKSTDNPLTFSADAAYTNVIANFGIDTKNVTVSTPYGTAVPGNQTVDYGTTITQRIDNIAPVETTPGAVRRVIRGPIVNGNNYTPIP